jgi:hypothetical protein
MAGTRTTLATVRRERFIELRAGNSACQKFYESGATNPRPTRFSTGMRRLRRQLEPSPPPKQV